MQFDDYVLVGYPSRVEPHSRQRRRYESPVNYNIVFVLPATASTAIRQSYFGLVKRLMAALAHEERLNGFVSSEIDTFLRIQEFADKVVCC